MELGIKYVWKGSGLTRRMVQKKDTFSYVPILAVLERMLQNSSIFQEVNVFVLFILLFKVCTYTYT